MFCLLPWRWLNVATRQQEALFPGLLSQPLWRTNKLLYILHFYYWRASSTHYRPLAGNFWRRQRWDQHPAQESAATTVFLLQEANFHTKLLYSSGRYAQSTQIHVSIHMTNVFRRYLLSPELVFNHLTLGRFTHAHPLSWLGHFLRFSMVSLTAQSCTAVPK